MVEYTINDRMLGRHFKRVGPHTEPKYTHAAVYINEPDRPDRTVIVWCESYVKAERLRARAGLEKYGVVGVEAEVIKSKRRKAALV